MIIYEIKNKNDGRPYVGYSSRFNSKEEFQQSNYWGSGKYIQRAIKKYGRKNFERKILLKNIFNFEELKRYEILWIQKKNSKKPYGYNLTPGGDGGNGGFGMKNKHHSQETKRTQSISRKKYFENYPEIRNKMSKRMTGKNNPMYGKHWDEKHNQIQSEKLKGRFIGEKNPMFGRTGNKNPRSRSVILISPDNDEYFTDCIKTFCIENNLNDKGIYNVLAGRRQHHKGWTAKYIKNDK